MSKRLLGLMLALGLVLLFMGLLVNLHRPFVGGWVAVANRSEFIWFGADGRFTTGEGSGEMRGRWSEVRPGVLKTEMEGSPGTEQRWSLSPNGRTLTLWDVDGRGETVWDRE